MARTAIAVQQVQKNKSGALTFAAADQANGMSFPNDGNTILRVKNTSGSPINVTVASVACSHGRTSDIVQAVAATTGDVQIGPLDAPLFNQTGGVVNVDFSAATGVTVAAIKQ
jgi:hypothetical protein